MMRRLFGIVLLAFAASAAVVGQQTAPRVPRNAAEFDELFQQVSNWSRWGKDDQLGSANLVTAAKRKQAIALARDAVSVSLAHNPLTERADDNPSPFEHSMNPAVSRPLQVSLVDTYKVSYHGYAHSHIDALCHIFHEGRIFNGYSAETVTAHGATRLGIHHLQSGIVTRGVLLDVPALRGTDALEPGEPIFPDDLEAAEERAGLQVGPGDALLVRTGRWRWRDEHGPWDLGRQAAGLDASCLPWLRQRDVATLGSDGVSDVLPSRVDGVAMPIHTVTIVVLGVHLMDNLDLDTLGTACGEEGRWEFLFTVAPLVLRRGTASPVNPIAVF